MNPHLPNAERAALLAQVDYTRVDLRDGTYIARTSAVAERLSRQSKRALITECREMWPELFRDGSWTTAYLRSLPAYVLAVILSQDDDAPSFAGQCRIINARIMGTAPHSKG